MSLLRFVLVFVALSVPVFAQETAPCAGTVVADVVALDQPLTSNRLGTTNPSGKIFALRGDVVPMDLPPGADPDTDATLSPGQVRLRDGKRPRPMVLRVAQGECLLVRFTNLLATGRASLHVAGLELLPADDQAGIFSDGTMVGANLTSAAMPAPGESAVYKLFAPKEGVYLMYSGTADPGNSDLFAGLFGTVNVEPPEAEFYRSQVTHDAFEAASMTPAKLGRGMVLTPEDTPDGHPTSFRLTVADAQGKTHHQVVHLDDAGKLRTVDNQPLIDYDAAGADGKPILKMTRPYPADPTYKELVHSDLTAVITGPGGGRFPFYLQDPVFYENPAAPDRRQPFREFTIIYHADFTLVPGFEVFNPSGPYVDLANALAAGADGFGINYGFAGIGPEIVANRMNVGPQGINGDEVDLKFEEFFLSSWAVGDPAMNVNHPANSGERATLAYWPDDPSNVYHSYMRDHLKFRIANVTAVPHVHHLHAHQWLHSPNSDDGHYLDSQLISGGTTFTTEITYNGSGNRNQTVGDSIFHCHFYPHFAAGMWSLWRVHDVLETGTVLNADGTVKTMEGGDVVWNRALPDGEITSGTPIPALVPMPTLGMPPMPAPVRLANAQDPTIDDLSMAGRRVIVDPVRDETGEPVLDGDAPLYDNPGFPFFIPGVAGHRPPHPPMDYGWLEDEAGNPVLDDQGRKQYLDGGLPRHQVLDGNVVRNLFTRWDFSKDFILFDTDDKKLEDDAHYLAGSLIAYEVPQDGTAVERAAMRYHGVRTHPTYQPNGLPGAFTTNGLPPQPGAPYADPAVDDQGNSVTNIKKYKAANIQLDVVLNKQGWHYPQQRILSLWYDVKPTINGERPPEPFFFRSHTGDTIEYWHTNLVPNYYDLDDFQVRTPTDVLGQHIHLVKFDVTSSDGAANGFNYEDGTFSPDEVRERIIALNHNGKGVDGQGGLYGFDPVTQFADGMTRNLTIQNVADYYPFFGPAPAYQNWNGAQTTIQRWDTDPLLNDLGEDRTLRTVFTHDHFSPSTHQQAGLYAGLLVEPEGSNWFTNAPTWQTGLTAPFAVEMIDAYTPLHTRPDGGPTTWQAIIHTHDPADSYREFMLEFQDMQLAYTNQSTFTKRTPSNPAIGAWLFVLDIPEDDSLGEADSAPDWMRTAFSLEGIVLSDDAYVTAGMPDNHCGTCEPLAGAVYTVVDTVALRPDGMCIIDMYPINGDNQVFAPCIGPGWADPNFAINPPTNTQNSTTPSNTPAPAPSIISGFPPNGTQSVNYRNEPIPSRLDTNFFGDLDTYDPEAVDPAYAFTSIPRMNGALNIQPLGELINPADAPFVTGNPEEPQPFRFPANPLNFNVSEYDPYTPLMNAYQGDNLEIRTLVGAHIDSHAFQIHGVKWHFEPSYENSGFRAVQGMGISEHFEMVFKLPYADYGTRGFADFLYQPASEDEGTYNGNWGLLRAYAFDNESHEPEDAVHPNPVYKLPNNPNPGAGSDLMLAQWHAVKTTFANSRPSFKTGVPQLLPPNYRSFRVVATTAAQVLQEVSGGRLMVNDRGRVLTNSVYGESAFGAVPETQLVNPFGLIYVAAEDLQTMEVGDVLRDGLGPQPLVLRAAAGDWIEIELENRFTPRALFEVPVSEAAVTGLNAGVITAALETALEDAGITVDGGRADVVVCGCAWRFSGTDRGVTATYLISRRADELAVFNATDSLAWVEGAEGPFGLRPAGSTDSGCDGYTLNPVCINTTASVGLNPQLVGQDINNSNGFNIGLNDPQTALEVGEVVRYYWYAGNLDVADGAVVATPIELGAVNLRASEPMVAYKQGLAAALIVEPEGSSWYADAGNRAAATVFRSNGPGRIRFKAGDKGDILFREWVVLNQMNLYAWEENQDVLTEDPQALGGFNFRAEPLSVSLSGTATGFRNPSGTETYNWMSNTITLADPDDIYSGDPKTPVFGVSAGMPTRVRFLYSGGDAAGGSQMLVMLDGHSWQEEPFVDGSTRIGDNPLSQQLGSEQIMPNQPLNLVLPAAGGTGHVTGDYALHTYLSSCLGGWGLMRVTDHQVMVTRAVHVGGRLSLEGLATSGAQPAAGAQVTLTLVGGGAEDETLGTVTVGADGSWQWAGNVSADKGRRVCAALPGGTCGTPNGAATTAGIVQYSLQGAKSAGVPSGAR